MVADLRSRGLAAEANEVRRDAAERGAAAVIAESLARWDLFRSTRETWIASAERVSPDAMARVRAALGARRGGRCGRAPREFYRDVAEWARQAHTEGRHVYDHVREQASLWGRTNPCTDTIRRWIRRAEKEGFLEPGEIRGPRKASKEEGK